MRANLESPRSLGSILRLIAIIVAVATFLSTSVIAGALMFLVVRFS